MPWCLLSSAATNFLMDTTLGTCNINPLRCKIKIPNCFYFILLLSYNFLNYFVIIYRVSFYPSKNHNAFIYVTKYTRYNKNQYKLQNCLSSARETSEIAVCRQIHHFQNIHACSFLLNKLNNYNKKQRFLISILLPHSNFVLILLFFSF